MSVVLVVVASACTSGDDAANGTTTSTAVTPTQPASPTTVMTTDATTPEPAGTAEPTTTAPLPMTPTTSPSTTSAPALVDVKVYFLRGERLAIVHRQVPGPAVLRGALAELLAGPTAAELAEGLITVIPAGTTLLDLDLADGLATIDLNAAYASGGGSLSMMARLAQVVFTATQFDNSDRVTFRLDGEPIDDLGGEGIVVDEPQTRATMERAISGSVIIETPVPGSTVSSPFTVIGEGDVFEGQFPIEVWADGKQIGGLAPVTAGAWGVWADFEVAITLDAPPGPIELIAYDPGGCGTDPECPPIIRTVVPLTFAG
jgi:spore germination protein GerM